MDNGVLIYKASAGSGKTFTLAVEYVATALGGEPGAWERILAVTFTNKATAEMKGRILERLFDVWQGCEEDDGFLAAVMKRLPRLSEHEVRERAGVALRAIVHDYDSFRVETIDAFFQSLLTNLARELGLSARFRVDIDDRRAIEETVDEVMGTLGRRPEMLAWTLDYVMERIEDNSKWDIRRELKDFARNLTREIYLLNEQRLRSALNDVEPLKRELRSLEAAEKKRVGESARRLYEKIAVTTDGFARWKGGNHLEKHLQNLIKGNLDPQPTATNMAEISDVSAVWMRKTDIKRHPEWLAEAAALQQLLQATETMREEVERTANSCFLTTYYLNPLRLLDELGKELDVLNEENNRIMLAKTPLLFRQMVEDSDAPFVFEKAGMQFQHVMIDEFQDTSTMQWANFKKLLLENLSSGGSCMLVGDVKQGIYRFRGGDWNILHGIRSEFQQSRLGSRMNIVRLDTNYRSDETVVAFNNHFFQRAAQELDRLGENRLAELYSDVSQQVAPGKSGSGYVRVCILPKPDRENRETSDESILTDMGAQITALHDGGLPYSDIALLLRKRADAEKVITCFSRSFPHIPLISEEAFLLSSSMGVNMLVSALRYMADATNTIALTYLRERYIKYAQADKLLDALMMHLPDLVQLPLYELIEKLITLLGLDHLPEESAYLFAFLDGVVGFLEENPSDLSLFLEYWEERMSQTAISQTSGVDGVRLVTIHKSKGLAFHTVMIPFCEWSIERDRADAMLWCEPSEAPYNKIPLVPVPGRYGQKLQNSVYGADYEWEHLQRRIENLNLLYVAFTRPKKNLYVWARGEQGLTRVSSMGDLLSTVLFNENDNERVFEAGTPVAGARRKPDAAMQASNPLRFTETDCPVAFQTFKAHVSFRQSNNAARFLASEDADTPHSRQQEYIDRGKVLHNLFSSIRTAADVDAAIEQARSAGVLADDKEYASLRRLIRERISLPQVAGWFDGSWELFNECSILSRGADGRLLVRRPDRVMVRPEETVVVDFKFGKPSREHAEQVASYMQLLRRMGRPAVKGYLWYVYNGQVVEVEEQHGE